MDDAAQSLRLLDVRPSTEFGICHIPGSISQSSHSYQSRNTLMNRAPDVPIKELLANPSAHTSQGPDSNENEIYVVCRLGNDSQLAVNALREAGVNGTIKDLIGGLREWSREIDQSFPAY